VSPTEPSKHLADALRKAIDGGDASEALEAADALVRGTDAPVGAPATLDLLESAVVAFPDEAGFSVRLLESCLRRRDWARFDARAAAARTRFPGRADLHFLVGRGAEDRGLVCAAIRAYGQAWRRDKQDLEAVQRMARLFRFRRRPFLARRRIRRALQHDLKSAPLHAALGYAYVDDAQYEKAVRAFTRAVRLEPDDSPYLDDLGGALLLSERWQEAAGCATKSLKSRPGSEKSWTVYAVAHRHLGDAEKAEKGYRKAAACAREGGRARGNLGLYLANRGANAKELVEAAEHLRAALAAHPDWEEVREALSALEPA
jgi:tetratricopeptide (TPR) repeat protein